MQCLCVVVMEALCTRPELKMESCFMKTDGFTKDNMYLWNLGNTDKKGLFVYSCLCTHMKCHAHAHTQRYNYIHITK